MKKGHLCQKTLRGCLHNLLSKKPERLLLHTFK